MLFLKIKYYIAKVLQLVISDKNFTYLRYFSKYKKFPNLKKPSTFNEKLAYSKIYDKSKKRTVLADKFLLKSYVSKILGKEYVIETLQIVNEAEDINFKSLPNSFILKATHGSGWNILIKNKANMNEKLILKKCKIFLSMNYYYYAREYQYFNMKPRIMIENLMLNENGQVPDDYKFFTFNGTVKYIQVDISRFSEHKRAIYDINWNKLPCEYHFPIYKGVIKKPKNFERMVEIATALTNKINFARVDMYSFNNKIYVGEITFTPEANLGKFKPSKFDKIFGESYTL